MPQEVVWTARTAKDPDDPTAKPETSLTVGDLRWLVEEALLAGLAVDAPVDYVPPIVGGDPQGWGLTVRAED